MPLASMRTPAGALPKSPDRGDAIPANADIGEKPRRARAIHHAGAGNDHVVGRRLSPQVPATVNSKIQTLRTMHAYQAIFAGKNSAISSS